MVAGFDKYFQIAPCFRDEDARADRSPGEFYQLDFEMSFVEQDDIFNEIEPLMYDLFKTYTDLEVSPYPFKRITYAESLEKFGTRFLGAKQTSIGTLERASTVTGN